MSKKIYVSILLGIVSGLLTYFSGMSQNNLVLISSVSITIFTLLANWYLYKSNKKIIYGFLLTGILLYLLEILGANTGIVYGEFVYSSLWQPALLGTPIIMAFVWATLVVESLFIVRQVYMRPFVQIITASVFLVMLDLVIDPGAIHLGLWSWVHGGPWYGVPYSNYIGWLILGIVGASVYYKFTKNTYVKINKLLHPTPILYMYTLSFWTMYNLLYGITTPACIGIILVTIILFILHKNIFNVLDDISSRN